MNVTHDMSVLSLITGASVLVQLVMAGLLLCSVFSWYYIFIKIFTYKRASKQSDKFEKEFWSGGDLNELFQRAVNSRDASGTMERLFESGFREFTNRALFTAGEVVTDAEVWLGDTGSVTLVIPRDVLVTVPRAASQNLDVRVVYEGPISAPIAKGAEIAKIVIKGKDLDPIEIPLQAASDIGRLGYVGRLKAAASYIVFGPPQAPAPQAAPAPAPAQ